MNNVYTLNNLETVRKLSYSDIGAVALIRMNPKLFKGGNINE